MNKIAQYRLIEKVAISLRLITNAAVEAGKKSNKALLGNKFSLSTKYNDQSQRFYKKILERFKRDRENMEMTTRLFIHQPKKLS